MRAAQEIGLSKIASIFTGPLQSKVTVTYTMQTLLGNTETFEGEHGIQIVDVRILNIMNDSKSLNLLTANRREAYVSYITFRKAMLEHKGVLPLLVYLSTDPAVAKTINITDPVIPSSYNSYKRAILS